MTTEHRTTAEARLRSSAEERAFWRALPDLHGKPFPSLIAAMDDIDALQADLNEAVAALRERSDVNHTNRGNFQLNRGFDGHSGLWEKCQAEPCRSDRTLLSRLAPEETKE